MTLRVLVVLLSAGWPGALGAQVVAQRPACESGATVRLEPPAVSAQEFLASAAAPVASSDSPHPGAEVAGAAAEGQPGSAAAEDAAVAGSGGPTPALFIGLLEVVGLSGGPAHLGVYATLGLSLSFPLAAGWSLIPSLGFEFSPELGAWGATGYLTAERIIYEGDVLLGLDLFAGLLHDAWPEAGGGFSHHLLPGGGVGLAVILGRLALMPSLSLYVGTAGEGWTLAPALLASAPL